VREMTRHVYIGNEEEIKKLVSFPLNARSVVRLIEAVFELEKRREKLREFAERLGIQVSPENIKFDISDETVYLVAELPLDEEAKDFFLSILSAPRQEVETKLKVIIRETEDRAFLEIRTTSTFDPESSKNVKKLKVSFVYPVTNYLVTIVFIARYFPSY